MAVSIVTDIVDIELNARLSEMVFSYIFMRAYAFPLCVSSLLFSFLCRLQMLRTLFGLIYIK